MREYLSKVNSLVWDKINISDLADSNNKYKLVMLGGGLLALSPYVSITCYGILAVGFVIYATYSAFCIGGILASIFSIAILSFLLPPNVNIISLVMFLCLLFLISFGLGKILKSHFDLIDQLNQTKRKLKESNQYLNGKLAKVKRVHKSFFPKKEFSTTQFFFNSFYQPAEVISGDYYYYLEMGDKVIGYISDVTGHGLDGALLNIFIREKINHFLTQHQIINSKQILRFLAKEFSKEKFPSDYALAFTFWVLNKKEDVLYYNSAGNHIPILVMNDQTIQEKIEKNPPLSSVFSEQDYNFGINKITFDCNSIVLFLTDGLIEQQSQNKRYGLSRLKKVIKESYTSQYSLLKIIAKDFNNFLSDNQPQDDITMFCIQKKDV